MFKPEFVPAVILAKRIHGSSDAYFKNAMKIVLSLPGYKEPHVENAALTRLVSIHLIQLKQYSYAKELLGLCTQMYLKTVSHGHEGDDEIGKITSLLGVVE